MEEQIRQLLTRQQEILSKKQTKRVRYENSSRVAAVACKDDESESGALNSLGEYAYHRLWVPMKQDAAACTCEPIEDETAVRVHDRRGTRKEL
jgi:hypothetical protein